MRKAITVECIAEDGNKSTVVQGAIERSTDGGAAADGGLSVRESKHILQPSRKKSPAKT
jgi:hypothetical protein